jgi:hypothetical protein
MVDGAVARRRFRRKCREAGWRSDPTLEVIINGSEMTWRGEHRDYQDKTIDPYEDGFRQVEVEFADQTDSGDALQLVVLPNGAMYAYNVHFVSLFVRPDP